MKKLPKSFTFAFVLVLIYLPPLHTQTSASPPAGANATAANITPTEQAPDDVMKKLSDFVHSGKYAEARQSVTALLILYPDDQRLLKAKTLLDKTLSSSKPPVDATSGNPPASTVAPAQAATNTNSEQLKGMDKVDYNALIVLARQAQENTDLEQQKVALKQFMDQSTSFLRKHADQMLLWKLRVASAISLNDPIAGYEAGQKLLAAGAADSNDPSLQELLAELRNKGWLDKQGAEDAQEYIWLRGLKLNLAYGEWSTGRGFTVHMKATMTLTVSGLDDVKESVGIRLENGSPKTCRLDGGTAGTFAIKPGDAAGGTYTTIRTATLLTSGWTGYDVACTVKASVVDKTGKEISYASINNGH